jgi:hypothetical protein
MFFATCGRWEYCEGGAGVEDAGMAVDLELEVVGPALRLEMGWRPEETGSVVISSQKTGRRSKTIENQQKSVIWGSIGELSKQLINFRDGRARMRRHCSCFS